MHQGCDVGRLIGEARRRILSNELLAQGAIAANAALAALILLLLLGSEILSWPVVIAVPLAALILGYYRLRKRTPSEYAVAQIVDERLGFLDTISTAVFFAQPGAGGKADAGVLKAQKERADRLAETADARQAIPMVMPRSAYIAAALMVAACSLFALRYGLTRRLDLKQPLANFLPESMKPGRRTEQANNQKRNPKQVPQAPDENGEGADQDQAAKGEQNSDQQTQSDAPAEAEGRPNANAKTPGKQQDQQPDSQMATDDQQEGGENGAQNSEDQNGQQGDGKNPQQQDKQGENKQQDANNNSENSSLMDKMKDAFQNLLSKVKPQQQQQNGQQQDQKGQQGKSQQGAKQKDGKQGQQQNAGQQGDAQEGENGEQAKNDENAQQQKGQGKSDSQQASKQPGSGVGSQDGDKAIKNAEQLAAMGKLSEIMGKRSQTITGEATVEVQQTNQQLKTNYVNKGVQHSQGGAEISRDEVPVALQPYVQQYFEQVRKQSGTAPVPAAGKK